VGHSIYEQNKAGYRASAIGSVLPFIVAMAIAIRAECHMGRISLPSRLKRNVPFLLRLKHRGGIAQFW